MRSRNLAKLAVSTMILQVALGYAPRASLVESHRPDYRDASTRPSGLQVAQATSPAPRNEQPPPTSEIAELTPGARAVSPIAETNGDRDFILVDKQNAVLYYFQNGQPVFSGTVLTGLSTADTYSKAMLSRPFSIKSPDSEKITPAGRFTVTRQHDDLYGTIFEINEIQGKDWTLAIHQVYLGNPKEKRRDRLNSATASDNHVTYGCINIDKEGIEFLSKVLPRKGKTPIYILPAEESSIPTFFPDKQKTGKP